MNLLQSTLSNIPGAYIETQPTISLLGIALLTLAIPLIIIAETKPTKKWLTNLTLALFTLPVLGGFVLGYIIVVGSTMQITDMTPANTQECYVNEAGINIVGSNKTKLPNQIEIAGKSVPVDNGGAQPIATKTIYKINEQGLSLLKLIGSQDARKELGLNSELQEKLQQIIDANKADALTIALQSEAPQIQQVGNSFRVVGTETKTLFGTDTLVTYLVYLSGNEMVDLMQEPTIAERLNHKIQLAKAH